MSSRHLARQRQLQEDERRAKAAADGSEEEEESSEEDVPAIRNAGFSAFGDSSSSSSDSDSDADDKDDAPAAKAASPPPVMAKTNAGGGGGGGSSAQQKKKAAQKKKQGKNNGAAESAAGDDLDDILASAGIDVAAAAKRAVLGPAICRVNTKSLNGETELKKRFGAGVVNGDRQGAKGHQRQLRKTLMISPRPNWTKPPTYVGGGLRMVPVDASEFLGGGGGCWPNADGDGCSFFEFEESDGYQATQGQFEFAQATNDPNSLIQMLHRHPYHIDTMLTLAEVYRHMGEMDSCAELISKCVYAYECSWHEAHAAAMAAGCARMRNASRASKGYFTALFRHMQLLGKTGCFATALETAKLLLSLDPCNDPTRVLLAIDYYALCSGDYRYVLELAASGLPLAPVPAAGAGAGGGPKAGSAGSDDGDDDDDDDEGGGGGGGSNSRAAAAAAAVAAAQSAAPQTVAALPNICFSAALARFQLGEDAEASVRALSDALLRFPCLLEPLLAKLDLASSRAFLPFLTDPLFRGAGARCGPAVCHVVAVYVERSGILWKPEKVLDFLRLGAEHAVKWGSGQSMLGPGDGGGGGGGGGPEAAAPDVALSKYLLAQLPDYSDEAVTMPAQELGGMEGIFGGGGGGPGHLGEDDVAAALEQIHAQEMGQQYGEGYAPDRLDPHTNALLLYMQTLMPWNVVDQNPGNWPQDGPQ
jgi:hypothetical protein